MVQVYGWLMDFKFGQYFFRPRANADIGSYATDIHSTTIKKKEKHYYKHIL